MGGRRSEEGKEGREVGGGGGKGEYGRGARRFAALGIGGYKGLMGIHELLSVTMARAEAIRLSSPAAECCLCRLPRQRALDSKLPFNLSIPPPVAPDFCPKQLLFYGKSTENSQIHFLQVRCPFGIEHTGAEE